MKSDVAIVHPERACWKKPVLETVPDPLNNPTRACPWFRLSKYPIVTVDPAQLRPVELDVVEVAGVVVDELLDVSELELLELLDVLVVELVVVVVV